jgi:hypothetical protein
MAEKKCPKNALKDCSKVILKIYQKLHLNLFKSHPKNYPKNQPKNHLKSRQKQSVFFQNIGKKECNIFPVPRVSLCPQGARGLKILKLNILASFPHFVLLCCSTRARRGLIASLKRHLVTYCQHKSVNNGQILDEYIWTQKYSSKNLALSTKQKLWTY